MATIADIARRAGLAYSTVAQIMQGRTNYRIETIAMVKAIAREVGYVPNYLGKSLAGGKSMSVGLYMENTLTDTAASLLYTLESQIHAHGYATYLVCGSSNPEAVNELGGLIGRRIDGLICHATAPRSAELVELLRKSAVPMVFIDRPIIEDHPATIGISFLPATNEMGNHMATLGFRQAQLLTNRFFNMYPERLNNLYRETLGRHGIEVEISDRWCCPWSLNPSAVAYDTVLANLKEKDVPELLLCFNDHAAIGAMAALHDIGLRIPEDVSVVGRDGIQTDRFLRPSLTTLVRPAEMDVAELAVNTLVKMITDPGFHPEQVTLNAHFQIGGSIRNGREYSVSGDKTISRQRSL